MHAVPVMRRGAPLVVDHVQLAQFAAGVGAREDTHDLRGRYAFAQQIEPRSRVSGIDERLGRQRAGAASCVRAQCAHGEETAGDRYPERAGPNRQRGSTASSARMVKQVPPAVCYYSRPYCRKRLAQGVRHVCAHRRRRQ